MSSDLIWFKSSYSDGEGGQCVEVALEWRKSTYSDGGGGQCVEVAASPQRIHVRDSKDVARPGFAVATDSWTRFLAHTVR